MKVIYVAGPYRAASEFQVLQNIRRAEDLLLRTDRSIADISLDIGYCDQSYFGAVFRKLAGITPAAYRRRYQRQQALEERRSNQSRAVHALSSLRLRPRSTERVASGTRPLDISCASLATEKVS